MRRVSTACRHLAHKVRKADKCPKMAKSGLRVKASSSEHSRELGTGADLDGICPQDSQTQRHVTLTPSEAFNGILYPKFAASCGMIWAFGRIVYGRFPRTVSLRSVVCVCVCACGPSTGACEDSEAMGMLRVDQTGAWWEDCAPTEICVHAQRSMFHRAGDGEALSSW